MPSFYRSGYREAFYRWGHGGIHSGRSGVGLRLTCAVRDPVSNCSTERKEQVFN